MTVVSCIIGPFFFTACAVNVQVCQRRMHLFENSGSTMFIVMDGWTASSHYSVLCFAVHLQLGAIPSTDTVRRSRASTDQSSETTYNKHLGCCTLCLPYVSSILQLYFGDVLVLFDLLVSVCLSVCLYVCICVCQTITFESLDAGSSYLHMRHISTHPYGQVRR